MDIAPRYRVPIMVLLALILVSIGVMVWAGQKRIGIYGPTLLASSSSGEIWAAVDDQLLVMDAEGRLLRQKDADALHIQYPFAALAPMGDRMLVGSVPDRRVHVVSGALDHEDQINPSKSAAGELDSMFHLLWDAESQRLIVADTGNHRLLALTRDGELVARAGGEGSRAFRFPNGMSRDPRGFILVADTNHHTLHAITSDLTDADWKMDYRAGGDDWPAFVDAAPDGQIYVAWLHSGMRLGTLRQHDANGRFVRELELQTEAEPIAILARKNDVLIADQSDRRYVIHRFDHAGHRLADFGDAAVQQVVAAAFAQRHQYSVLRDAARIGVIALGVVLIALAIFASVAGPGEKQAGDVVGSLVLEPLPPTSWWTLWRQEWRQAVDAWWPVVLVLGLFIALRIWDPDLKPAVRAMKEALDIKPEDFHWFVAAVVAAEIAVLFVVLRLAARATRLWEGSAIALAMKRRQAHQAMKRALKALSRRVEPEETLESYRLVVRSRQPQLLIATNRRLLLFPFMPFGGSRIVWEADWNLLGPPVLHPAEGWKKWLTPARLDLEFTRIDHDKPLRVVCPSKRFADDVQRMVTDARQKWWSSKPVATPPRPIDPMATSPKDPRTLKLAVLSLLWPGLAQMHQRRIGAGIGLMVFGGVVLGYLILSWTVQLKHIADQPANMPLILVAIYAITIIAAFSDALQQEPRRR